MLITLMAASWGGIDTAVAIMVSLDLRLVEVVDLECDEALLTGESIPVEKTIKPLGCRVDSSSCDKNNISFSSADHDDLGNDGNDQYNDDDDNGSEPRNDDDNDDKKGKGKVLQSVRAETGEPDLQETKKKGKNEGGKKLARQAADDIPIGDRTNVAFMSSTVTKGRGKGIAMNTGQRTELGKIADSIASQPKNKTELEVSHLPSIPFSFSSVRLASQHVVIIIAVAEADVVAGHYTCYRGIDCRWIRTARSLAVGHFGHLS